MGLFRDSLLVRFRRNLFRAYLKPCFATRRGYAPWTFRIDRAKHPPLFIFATLNNLARNNSRLRVRALFIEGSLAHHRSLFHESPHPARCVAQDALDPSRLGRISKSYNLDSDFVHPSRLIDSATKKHEKAQEQNPKF